MSNVVRMCEYKTNFTFSFWCQTETLGSGLFFLLLFNCVYVKMRFPIILVSVLLFVLNPGISDDDIVRVSVMEGDSVTLNTTVYIQQEEIKWYFNKIRIAEINGDLSDICTDVQCNERFRDRLKLDHQTGSLTIMNTKNTDSGVYELKLIDHIIREKIYNVTIHGFPEPEKKSVKEGESLILDPDEIRKPNDVMRWYFNEILIAEITGNQSKICEDDWCKERFRDRLKLDHQTGTLTIMNITNANSGEYKLKISNISPRRINSGMIKNHFRVTVIPDSGLSSGSVAGIVVGVLAVLLAAAAAAVIIYRKHRGTEDSRMYRSVEIEEMVRTPDSAPVSESSPDSSSATEPAPDSAPVAEPSPDSAPVAEPAPDSSPVAEPAPDSSPVAEPAPDSSPVAEPAPDSSPVAEPLQTPLLSLSPLQTPLLSLSPLQTPLLSLSPLQTPLLSPSPLQTPLLPLSPLQTPRDSRPAIRGVEINHCINASRCGRGRFCIDAVIDLNQL
ncbi:V-set and immunoglobulin domain-containing protein 1-like isoform X2 [Megalobrama amblycephala]|uniref:V-set and immunoglobulin domain-containing protein 1-like isoform X2 n=1 Tax=Megalobrama amblycephala TaxID=75352 RepID=UPI0020146ECA|nr:V-set and immunoglobulin domain-containing protein 1-like isoform X2 [Megalobrama amblycephala]